MSCARHSLCLHWGLNHCPMKGDYPEDALALDSQRRFLLLPSLSVFVPFVNHRYGTIQFKLLKILGAIFTLIKKLLLTPDRYAERELQSHKSAQRKR